MGKYIAEIPDERILEGCCYVPDERDEPIPVEKCSDWLQKKVSHYRGRGGRHTRLF